MAKPRKKAVKKYTLGEFKAWLEGVEEIQPDDWHPDLTQWRMIREKIAAIVEPPKKPSRPPPAAMPPRVTPPPQAPVMQPPPQLHPSNLSAITGDTGAPIGDVDMTPAAKAAMQGKLPASATAQPNMAGADTSNRVKTPNIDTMDGSYDSSFS
jgi:hypothetical protein